MAPIRKAKGYVTYLMALLITGLFGLFHKAPPAWAEDVKVDHNAQVFSSAYKGAIQVAENKGSWTDRLGDSKTLIYSKPPTGERMTFPPEATPGADRMTFPPEATPGADRMTFPPEATPGADRMTFPPEATPGADRMTFPPEATPGQGGYVLDTKSYAELNAKLQSIYSRDRNTPLTTEEMMLLMSVQNAQQDRHLQNQLNVLMLMIKDLQSKLPAN
ncbi:MAG TPA: hypothetical protein VLJ37_09935 [bacterium]|nr:hypothetical protein [bacterium]